MDSACQYRSRIHTAAQLQQFPDRFSGRLLTHIAERLLALIELEKARVADRQLPQGGVVVLQRQPQGLAQLLQLHHRRGPLQPAAA